MKSLSLTESIYYVPKAYSDFHGVVQFLQGCEVGMEQILQEWKDVKFIVEKNDEVSLMVPCFSVLGTNLEEALRTFIFLHEQKAEIRFLNFPFLMEWQLLLVGALLNPTFDLDKTQPDESKFFSEFTNYLGEKYELSEEIVVFYFEKICSDFKK